MLPSEVSQGTGHLVALMRPCFVTKRGWESFYMTATRIPGPALELPRGWEEAAPPDRGARQTGSWRHTSDLTSACDRRGARTPAVELPAWHH